MTRNLGGRLRAPKTMEVWALQGACVGDMEPFFREEGGPPASSPEDVSRTERAKALCRECSVWDLCAAAALKEGVRYGVWGGYTPGERDRMPESERNHIIAAAAACLTDLRNS